MTDWFASRLLNWYNNYGRKDLPWQHPRTPYTVWISEVMLQQTQVATVIPYFQRFLRSFPSVTALAGASLDDVLHHWSGLGYYSRARNLHRAAQTIVEQFNGEFPERLDALESLPGIGRSTAGAILAMGFNIRATILDGNVKRVLARFHGVEGFPGESAVQRRLWELSESHTPDTRVAEYTQASMDIGATLCTRRKPACMVCPLHAECAAFRQGRVHELPAPRPRRDLPVKDRNFWLIMRDDGACLLERRPTTGLWGGLWSPPERATDLSLDRVQHEFGLDLTPSNLAPPEPFTHVFTHLKMNVLPHRVDASSTAAVADRDDLLWYRPGINTGIGLSAAAARLLESIYGNGT